MEEKMNSKWLVERLADVEAKVRRMIIIIDEDADSFARRAEMFYKRRPELMKLVGEFHSAYQGLAARYDRVAALLRFDPRLADVESFDGDLADFYSASDSNGRSRARRSLRFEDDVDDANSFTNLEILALKAEMDVLNDEKRRCSESTSDLRKLLNEEVVRRENVEKVNEGMRCELARKEEEMNKMMQSKVAQVKSHNRSLSEVNLSLALAMKDSRSEISDMKEAIVKLEGEIETLAGKNRDQREEISFLKGELVRVKDNGENSLFSDSRLADMKIELEKAKIKMKDVEGENFVLVSNNSFLVTHLQSVNRNLEKVLQEKSSLEKGNFEANLELQELREKAKVVEDSYRILQSQACSRGAEMDQMKEKLAVLDLENGKLKSQIGSYAGAFVALKESVAVLENRSIEHTPNEEQGIHSNKTKAGGYSDLNELQVKIENIERLVAEREKNLMMENAAMKTKLDAAIIQLGEFKPKNTTLRQWSSKGKRSYKLLNDDLKMQSMEDLNDILLGETSEFSSVGFSRPSTVDLNDMWDSSVQKSSIDLTVENYPKGEKGRSERKLQRRRSKSLVEKEVTLDNLVVSKIIPPACLETQDRKIVDRLDSDAQKLTRLHITVQELKRTMEMAEKVKRGGGLEYECVKEQMEESEEAIIKLFNVNLRLRRSVEADAMSMDETSALAFEEKRGVARRKVSDQAKRMSDKIGRLQLEVQKMQFLIIKLDDQSKSRPKIKIAERKTRVLLRDFLYSSGTRGKVPKRSNFCACAQPLTKGD